MVNRAAKRRIIYSFELTRTDLKFFLFKLLEKHQIFKKQTIFFVRFSWTIFRILYVILKENIEIEIYFRVGKFYESSYVMTQFLLNGKLHASIEK